MHIYYADTSTNKCRYAYAYLSDTFESTDVGSSFRISYISSRDRLQVKFVCEGHRVNVKVTGAKEVANACSCIINFGRQLLSVLVRWRHRPHVADGRALDQKARLFVMVTFNRLYSKVGRLVSEEVILSFLQSKFLPILLYATELCPLLSHDR